VSAPVVHPYFLIEHHYTCLDEVGDPAAPPPHGAAGGGDHTQRAGRRVARAEGRRPCKQYRLARLDQHER
jgi:hypothetical protein